MDPPKWHQLIPVRVNIINLRVKKTNLLRSVVQHPADIQLARTLLETSSDLRTAQFQERNILNQLYGTSFQLRWMKHSYRKQLRLSTQRVEETRKQFCRAFKTLQHEPSSLNRVHFLTASHFVRDAYNRRKRLLNIIYHHLFHRVNVPTGAIGYFTRNSPA